MGGPNQPPPHPLETAEGATLDRVNKKRQNLKPEGVYPDKDEKHYQMLIRPLKSFSRGLLLEMA